MTIIDLFADTTRFAEIHAPLVQGAGASHVVDGGVGRSKAAFPLPFIQHLRVPSHRAALKTPALFRQRFERHAGIVTLFVELGYFPVLGRDLGP